MLMRISGFFLIFLSLFVPFTQLDISLFSTSLWFVGGLSLVCWGFLLERG